jgi:chromosome segregation ATPase
LPNKASRIEFLEMEKRLSELEKRLKSLEKSVEKVDLEDMKKRLEDLEDLVMVENALILEIKKMMENYSELTDLKNRIKNLEDSISGKLIEELKKVKIGNMNELAQKIERIEKDLALLQDQVSTMDFTEVREKIEKKIAEGLVGKNIKEILQMQNTILRNEARINNLERSVEFLKASIKELQPILGLENVKKLGILANEVTRRVEEFHELLARVDALQSNVENRLSKISVMESEVGNIKVWMDKLSKDLENLNEKILELKKRQEENRIYLTEKMLAQTEGVLKEVQDSIARTKDEIAETIEKKINAESIHRQIEELSNMLTKLKEELESLKVSVQELKEMQVFPEERLNELMSRNIYLEDKISALEKIIKEIAKVSPIVLE